MKNILFMCCFATLIFMCCVTPIDFESQDSQFVAISGVISNNPQERRITVFENVQTNTEISGNLYKNGELEAPLVQIQRRTLGVPPSVVIEPGATYHIEIITNSGDIYMSEPQEVFVPRKPEMLKAEVFPQNFTRENGAIVEGHGINVLAEMAVSEQNNPYFVRLQMGEAWQYQEVADPRAASNDSTLFTCFITKGIRNFPPQIWTSAGKQIGNQEVLVANREVDQSFLLRHYFNVYTYPISEKAYTYYENTQKITENSGTLLDEIPAAIRGNIFNANNEKEIVYGFVEFSVPDTSRMFVDGLNITIQNTCGVPQPCLMPTFGVPLPDCPCANCLFIEGASYERPAYFQ